MIKNTQARTRKANEPYEVWVTPDRTFEYRVLKKYQIPKNEAKNRYARWFLSTKSTFTWGMDELGDGYVVDVKARARKVFDETEDGPFPEWVLDPDNKALLFGGGD